MATGPTRRTVLTGLGAAALVTGFDPASRAWATDRAAKPAARAVPALKGQLILHGPALTKASDDFGHLVHEQPWAVLKPGSIEDIERMVKFCAQYRIPVAARGQGHGTYGQAQVDGGLVIAMSTLDAVAVHGDTVTVEAGALWRAVVHATLANKLTPPVMIDFLDLSVGGTLSVGGIGGAAPHYGAQVDTVAELEVVTGTGERAVCSAALQPDLFYAALAGLGQCGIIVRAKLRLVPAPKHARHYILFYETPDALTADQRMVQADGRFSFVQGEAALNPDGPGWVYFLEAAAWYDTTPPDDSELLSGMNFVPGSQEISSMGYFAFLDRIASGVAELKANGEWYDPHPWWNMFLPDSTTDAFVTEVMGNLTEADLGTAGVILLYPLNTSLMHAPLLRVPDEPVTFLFSVLRVAAPCPGAMSAAEMMKANRALYRQGRAAGAYQYAIGSIPFTRADWRQHFGPQWQFLEAARRRYDPAGILAPGQGIFPPPQS